MLQIYYIYNLYFHKNTFMPCFPTSWWSLGMKIWCTPQKQSRILVRSARKNYLETGLKSWKITYYMSFCKSQTKSNLLGIGKFNLTEQGFDLQQRSSSGIGSCCASKHINSEVKGLALINPKHSSNFWWQLSKMSLRRSQMTEASPDLNRGTFPGLWFHSWAFLSEATSRHF